LALLDKVNNIDNITTRKLVLDKLSKNNSTYQKADSVIERISNMGSWLLSASSPSKSDVISKLAMESKQIPDTSKNQKGVLQDLNLVAAICSITQLDYFRKQGHLKITELAASRLFASPVSDKLFISLI